MRYPGACSLAYQHLIQIVIEVLLGWDPKTHTGTKGVFGTLEAWTRADEEQGRKSLHSHWQLWIKGINGYRTHFYHKDDAVKSKARKIFLGYVDKVMTATYGDDFIITDNCDCSNDGPVVAKKPRIYSKSVICRC